MTFKLIDIAVTSRQPHPSLARRVVGQVEAMLEERTKDFSQTHPVSVRIFIDAAPGDTSEDIDTALLMKASTIVMRVKARLEASQSLLAAE